MPDPMQDTGDAIWDQLVAVITAATVVGQPLAGVKNVGKSIHLWTEQSPAIGVQMLREPETPMGIGKHHIDFEFQIVIGASSVETDPKRANLDDANALVRPLRTALKTLLRHHYGLDGLAYRTQIHGTNWVWRIEDGDGVPVWAYAIIDYTVSATVMIQ